MTRQIISIIWGLIPFTVFAQQYPSEAWHKGKIVLIEGDTLNGEIRYSQETDVVEYLDGTSRTAIALSGQKVLYFEIFDGISGRYRQFFALPYAFDGDYETPIFFEVIHEGQPVSLLSRERLEFVVTNPPFSIGPSYGRLELVYTYYFLNESGDIKKFSGRKKDLYFYFKDRAAEIKKYIKGGGLQPKNRAHLLDVVMYYNKFYAQKISQTDG